MCQRKLILRELIEGNKVSPLSALRDFGCMRLASRIYELREQGYLIVSDERNQKGKRYCVYRMTEQEQKRALDRLKSA